MNIRISKTNKPENHNFTSEIQLALDTIRDDNGGTLVIGPGTFQIGSIQLYSNTTLQLEPGSILLGSSNIKDFTIKTLTVAELSCQALIYSRSAYNVKITGIGEIYGNAKHYFASEKDKYGYKCPHQQRPRMIVFEGCENVYLDGFSIKDAPMWTAHLVSCRNVIIHNLTFDNSLDLPNTDALDIDSCQQVDISHCYFSAADDAICIKTTDKCGSQFSGFLTEAKSITIANCTLRSKSCALKVGTETFYHVTDLVARNVVIYETNRAIGLFARDGGCLKRMTFSHFKIETRFSAPVHWGKADPIHISLRPRLGNSDPGTVEFIDFNHFEIKCKGAINFFSNDRTKMKSITLKNINIQQSDDPDSSERGLYDIRPPINPDNPNGMGLDNAYCINPQNGLPYGVEYYKGGLPVVYCSLLNQAELKLACINVIRPPQLPKDWNKNHFVYV